MWTLCRKHAQYSTNRPLVQHRQLSAVGCWGHGEAVTRGLRRREKEAMTAWFGSYATEYSGWPLSTVVELCHCASVLRALSRCIGAR